MYEKYLEQLEEAGKSVTLKNVPSTAIKTMFVDLFVIIFYHTDFQKSIHFHLIFGILGIVRAAACQILVCYFTAHEHWSLDYPSRSPPAD